MEKGAPSFRLSLFFVSALSLIITGLIYLLRGIIEAGSFFLGAFVMGTLAFLTGEAVGRLLQGNARKRTVAFFILKIFFASAVIYTALKVNLSLIFMAGGTIFVAFFLPLMLIFLHQTDRG